MRVKERRKRFLVSVLILGLLLSSISEAVSYVAADSVAENSEAQETSVGKIFISDKDGAVVDSNATIKYRIVAADNEGEGTNKVYPEALEDPLEAEAENGCFAIALTADNESELGEIIGIQVEDISYENYTVATIGGKPFSPDSLKSEGEIGSSEDEGFFSVEALLADSITIQLSGRPEFAGELTVTAENAMGEAVSVDDWAKSIEISGGILKQDTEEDYSKYSVYYYKESNSANTKIESSDENGTFTFIVSDNGEEKYHFYVKLEESENTYLSKEQIVSVKKDDESPELTISTQNMSGNDWVKSVLIQGTVRDTVSEIAAMYYAWDNGEGSYNTEDKKLLNDISFEEKTTVFEFWFPDPEEEGNVYNNKDLYLIAVDKAGNEIAKKVTLNLDCAPPEIIDIQPENADKWTNKEVTITFKVKDGENQSGVKTAYYSDNADGMEGKEAEKIESEEENIATYTFTVPAEKSFQGEYSIWAEDNAGNVSEKKKIMIRIDTDVCIISDGQANPADWTNKPVTVTGTIYDELSGVERDSVIYYKKGSSVTGKAIVSDNDSDGSEINYEFTLEPDDYEGEYIVSSKDIAGNITTRAAVSVKMDKTAPKVVSVNPSTTGWIKGGAKLIVTGSVMDIVSNDTVSGITTVHYGKTISEPIGSEAVSDLSKGMEENSYDYEFEISSTTFVNDTYYIWCEDKAGNLSEPIPFQVKIDTDAPVIEAEASEEDWTKNDVTISGTIHDGEGSGIASAYIQKVDGTTKEAITIDASGRFSCPFTDNMDNEYIIVAEDSVGNSTVTESFHVKIDKEEPKIVETKYSENWSKEAVKVDVTVTDEPEGSNSGVKQVCWKRQDENVQGEESVDDEKATLSIGLAENESAFEGEFEIWCVDGVGNESSHQKITVKIDQKEGILESWTVSSSEWTNGKLIVKGIAKDEHSGVKGVTYAAVEPEKITISENREGTALTEDFFNYSFTLERQNYSGNYIIQVEDNVGNTSLTTIEVKMDATPPAIEGCNSSQKENAWTKDTLEISGRVSDNLSGVESVYYSTQEDLSQAVPVDEFEVEENRFSIKLDNEYASYDQIENIYIWCVDTAGNESEEKCIPIWLDNTTPKITEVISETRNTFFDKLLEFFTLGGYQAPTELKIVVNDNSNAGGRKSDISSISWVYEEIDAKDGDGIVKSDEAVIAASDLTERDEYSESGYWEGTLVLSGDYRGKMAFTVYDNAGNSSSEVANFNGERRILIDTKKPIFTGYEYTNPQTQSGQRRYYNSADVTVRMRIEEANFSYNDAAETGVTVLDNNAQAQSVSEWTNTQQPSTWESMATLRTEGEHTLTTNYTDPAGNVMDAAQSETIIIDRTAPVISVTYNENNSNNYYNAVRRATITVREVNFDAGRVNVSIGRTNVLGQDLGTINYNGQNLSWSHNGNDHTAQINCSDDANYTFEVTARDLANNEASRIWNTFTVDKTSPTNLSISYENSNAFERIVDNLTFTNFYNNQIRVTISATDTTSGVESFVYSYRKGEDVSAINAELINAVISRSEIVQNGNTYSTTFYIPRGVLGNVNQFNGNVNFTAYDRAGNSSELQDGRRIIVDNISPTAEITYGTPVREANGVAYYDGDIEATLVINEANFDANEVEVLVTQDGSSSRVTPNWTDNSVDVHTGSFTISGDGDYTVSVNYTDYSDNQMTEYTSEQMTIDTEAPTVLVSGIQANSATNSEENFSFTITAEDTNLDSSTFKPVLTAVIPDEQGNYQTTEISLGEMTETPNGDKIASATYSVENLESDAFYTLTCTVSDMVNHTNQDGVFSLVDKEGNNGGEMGQVQFSINREGSTFHVTDLTGKILSDYYIKNLNDNIVIEEINVDPIENYEVELNGTILEEAGNYTTVSEGNGADGSWCKRTYSLNSALFEEEGEYNIVVHSTDKAYAEAYNDVKNVRVAFVVDETAPTVTISGLSENGRYQTTEQKVTVLPKDDGGKLNSFEALVDGESQILLSGEELEDYLAEHDGMVEVTVSEGINKEVEIICMDYAIDQSGNGDDYNVYRETFGNVTVSPNGFVIFYANKPLFFGSIGGVVVVVAGILTLIILKKKKGGQKAVKQ